MRRNCVNVLAWAAALFGAVVAARADVLYDRTDMTDSLTYDSYVNVGLACAFGFCSDARAAEDFSLSEPHGITAVTIDLGSNAGARPQDGEVWVEFYRDAGGHPEQTPFAIASGLVTTVPIPNDLAVWGAFSPGADGYRTRIELVPTGLGDVELAAGTWWVSVVASSNSDGYLLLRDSFGTVGHEIHIRDGDNPTATVTRYGTIFWMPYQSVTSGTDGGPGGDVAIKIEGVPIGGGTCACEMTADDPANVDVFDLLAYLDLWFVGDPGADFTGDDPGQIDVFDLLAFLDCWFAATGNACT